MTTAESFSYSLYGLTFESNMPLPALPRCESSEVDVRVVLGRTVPAFNSTSHLWYVSPVLEGGVPIVTARKADDNSAYSFDYYDGTKFLVNGDGSEIFASWSSNYSLENTCYYLVGQIAAFVLRLRGVLCLHGSTVLIDRGALTISGDSGSGKSTTAAMFARRGFPVLTEDVTAILEVGDQFMIQAGYPRINLWPDTVDVVYGPQHDLPLITTTWEKQYLDLTERDCFHYSVAPLRALYVLGERSESLTAPYIESLSPGAALISLLTHAHGRFLVDSEMRERELTVASRIVNQTHVRRVIPNSNLEKVDAMIDLILTDYTKSVAGIEA